MAPRSFASLARNFAGLMDGGLQSGEWSHAGIDHHGEFIVRLKPGKQKGFMASVPAIIGAPAPNMAPRMCWSAEKNTASKLILRVVPDAELRLDAFLPACAGFFANVGEPSVGSKFGFV